MAKIWHRSVGTIRARKPPMLPLLGLLLIVLSLGFSGCAAQTEPQAKPRPLAQQPARPAVTPTPAVAVAPAQKIQDLTVREERGQTILLMKFSQPLSNYRHFPLPNPGESSWTFLATPNSPALVFAWQALRVRYTYDGNWSALFCTGSDYPIPPELEHERLYRFSDVVGFDGQVYHYIAHDPIYPFRFQGWIHDPGLRYRRILVPLVAFLAAGGASDRVDWAYRALVIGWIFLGAYWVARYAALCGRRPAWGLAFLLVPTVLLSAERMTVDVALAAVCAGVAVQARRGATVTLCLLLGLFS